jgi:hypothetical protein
MSNPEIGYYEFFIAALPAKLVFEMDVEELKAIVAASTDHVEGKRVMSNNIAEVCLIGLASYFEAFCKSQFASIVNICPQTLNNFTAKRDNVSIDLKDILRIPDTLGYKLGFLLSEKYDFGSAKSVNSLYHDLLGITPFSTKDAERYSEFLGDRNLLVHHRGVYTFKYQGQRFAKVNIGDVHMQSLIVTKKDFDEWAGFLYAIAEKINLASYKSLKEFLQTENIQLPGGNMEAIECLLWGL